jgi:hypothetical protein
LEQNTESLGFVAVPLNCSHRESAAEPRFGYILPAARLLVLS